MATVGITKTKTLFSRHLQSVGRCMSTAPARVHNQETNLKGSSGGSRKLEDSSSCWWVPHPRTGIYFPQGHERVMEDVPIEEASFKQTYWLRSIDGVDKPDPDDLMNNSIHDDTFYFDTKNLKA